MCYYAWQAYVLSEIQPQKIKICSSIPFRGKSNNDKVITLYWKLLMFLHLGYYRQKHFSIWKEKRLNHCQSANIHKCEYKITGAETSLRWKINVKSFDY